MTEYLGFLVLTVFTKTFRESLQLPPSLLHLNAVEAASCLVIYIPLPHL